MTQEQEYENKKEKRDRDCRRFIHRLSQLEAGDRAKLKRNSGNTLSESRTVIGLFYRQLISGLNHIKEWDEETLFLVATLYPFDKKRFANEQSQQTKEELAELEKTNRSFGWSLHKIREKNRKEAKEKKLKDRMDGFDRRVERLLDADGDQLRFYLRREMHYITNQGATIDWEQLLFDLLRWNHPDRYVQRRWARDYFVSREQVTSDTTD